MKTPDAVGVPLITPVELRLIPAGSVPVVTPQLIGAVPVAVSVCEYAVPVDATGRDMVVMVGGAFTVRLNCWELEPPALVALAVKVETPMAVGLPLMMPVEEPKESPAGSVPLVTVQVIGEVPVAVSVCE